MAFEVSALVVRRCHEIRTDYLGFAVSS